MEIKISQIYRSNPLIASIDEENVKGVSYLIAAAVVDPSFQNLLLSDPAQALDKGYRGHFFYLTPEERHLILSIRATNLPEFAKQLLNSNLNSQKG